MPAPSDRTSKRSALQLRLDRGSAGEFCGMLLAAWKSLDACCLRFVHWRLYVEGGRVLMIICRVCGKSISVLRKDPTTDTALKKSWAWQGGD